MSVKNDFIFFKNMLNLRIEKHFFVFLLVLLVLFSMIYFLVYRQEVVSYVLDEYEKSKDEQPAKFSFRNYCRCFWVSCIILVNPKFPSNFFRLSKGLFLWFTLQWLLSLMMVILFLVYIASKYQFLTKLTGIWDTAKIMHHYYSLCGCSIQPFQSKKTTLKRCHHTFPLKIHSTTN